MPPHEVTRRPRLVIVGLGLAGGAMAAAAQAHPRIELVGAVEPDPAIRERFTAVTGLPAYADLDPVLADPEVDAVYLATPHQLHAEQTVRSAAAGKHILVEKPMALTVADCDAMVAAADAAGVALVVGHTHGFSPAVAEIGRLVRSGAFGRLGMIAAWNYTDFLYRPRRPEELDTSRGGGILFNQIPHQVDMIRTIATAPVTSVRAHAVRLDPARPTEGAATALLGFADGAAATLTYSGYDHFDSDELHDWVAEGGSVKTPAHGSARAGLADLSAEAERQARTDRLSFGRRKVARPAHQPHFGELVVTCAGADLRPGTDDVVAYTDAGVRHLPLTEHQWWPGRGDVLAEFAAAIDGTPVVHDGRFGRDTVIVSLAIAESARTGQEIRLEAPEPTPTPETTEGPVHV
ncbi:Gfo/Idh/MocA family protein [Granulicoccus phenolivorans]|uniref:Gfo/Idh/MocA family protein n=1 Tax=Granulicoccus phenolivorans TaxID=266854 RepID=UPI0004031A45|nr:Gfo/Idh/MocA family oxidoreductase [Granulicoccus phenolivorans]